MQQHLFVYGTLGPNKPNAHILEVIAGTWSKGSVKGLLKEAGWGAELGFPGLMLNSDGQTVDGYIFSSEQLDTLWNSLSHPQYWLDCCIMQNSNNGITARGFSIQA